MSSHSRIWFLVAPLALSLLALSAAPSRGDDGDTMKVAIPDTSGRAPSKKEPRLFYGGSIGFSLSGRVLWLNIQPLVGYKLTPKASVGARLNYQYVSDRRFNPAVTSLGYGASLFTRYRVLPQLYGLTEFEYVSIDLGENRELVPFLLVGAGYVQPLAPKTSLTTEILIDVLRDERGRLYRDQGPRVNVGVGVGY
jgi:hypothetical protein